MQFRIKKRDGPGRGGELSLINKNISTPNVLFLDTIRIKPPEFADILLINKIKNVKNNSLRVGKGAFSSTVKNSNEFISINDWLIYPKDAPKELHLSSINYNKKEYGYYIIPANAEILNDVVRYNNAIIYIVANALQLFNQHSKFVEFIIKLRNKIGYQRIIYIPCIGTPTSFSLLTYMGIDLFDSTSAVIAARNEMILFPNGGYNKNKLDEKSCCCPVCYKMKGSPKDMNFNEILNHNYFMLRNEIVNIRNAISLGSLRELVETRVRGNPNLVSLLKILDLKHYNYLEKRVPVFRKSKLLATSEESLSRPEIKRFQNRLIDRYLKPNSAKVLLLLPCSAKKPYSFSKTHGFFKEALYKTKNPFLIHELIITFPMGIVPRELELTYPASKYDIAVTGHWSEDEKSIIRNLLKSYFDINQYDTIISHLPSDINVFISDTLKDPIKTCEGKPTSNKSLIELSKILNEVTRDYSIVKKSERIFENVKSLFAYQFGMYIADKFLVDCKIKGKYPYLKIMYKEKQLGMITIDRGLISLTMEGAIRLSKYNKYWVEIYDDFILKGSLFAPGVKDSDPSIRIGDEVVVLRNYETCGVGVAQMNGEEMKESSSGEALKIRHRI